MAHSYNAPACCRELQWPSDVQCISAAQPAAAGNGLLVKIRALRREPSAVTMLMNYRRVMTCPAAGTRTGARSVGETRSEGALSNNRRMRRMQGGRFYRYAPAHLVNAGR